MTVNATNDLDVYVGSASGGFKKVGTSVTSTGSGAFDDDTTLDFFVGGADEGTGCASSCFNGKLDDVRVYNRALSAAEITRLYNMDHTGP